MAELEQGNTLWRREQVSVAGHRAEPEAETESGFLGARRRGLLAVEDVGEASAAGFLGVKCSLLHVCLPAVTMGTLPHVADLLWGRGAQRRGQES